MGRSQGDVSLHVSLRHRAQIFNWDGSPGIEFWRLELLAIPRLNPEGSIEVAVADLVRVDNNVCWETSLELDHLDYDLGMIGGAIATGWRILESLSIYGGADSTTLIAELVIVDPYWRGRRLGPSLVLLGADLLRADAVFLMPAALKTHFGSDGRLNADYDRRRGSADDLARVRKAWKRSGFRVLNSGVVFRAAPDDHGKAARTRISSFERVLQTSSGRRWFRRRANRIEGGRLE